MKGVFVPVTTFFEASEFQPKIAAAGQVGKFASWQSSRSSSCCRNNCDNEQRSFITLQMKANPVAQVEKKENLQVVWHSTKQSHKLARISNDVHFGMSFPTMWVCFDHLFRCEHCAVGK